MSTLPLGNCPRCGGWLVPRKRWVCVCLSCRTHWPTLADLAHERRAQGAREGWELRRQRQRTQARIDSLVARGAVRKRLPD